MLKQDALNPLPVPTVCGNCGLEEHHLLLHIRHRSILRRLCTTCVLRLHAQSFCPTCFIFYGSSPPQGSESINCTKCYSISHSRCAAATMGPYVCPLCVNPNSPIFVPRKVKEGREMDTKAGKVLFAAARIAAATMEKAAEGAKAEAEKRAKEAAFTRKRAKEALEHVAALEAQERLNRKKISTPDVSVPVLGRNQKNCDANNSFIAKNPVTFQEPSGSSNQVDGPIDVSVSLNAVGLKERLPEFTGPISASSAPKSNGTVRAPAQNVGGSINNFLGEKGNNGLYSVPPAVDRLQHLQSSHVKEENSASQQ